MSCHFRDAAFALITELNGIQRPRLLLRTARHGLADYNRTSDLRRILRRATTPPPGAATVRDLIDLEATINQRRTRPPHEIGEPWRAAAHIDVLIALLAEAQLLSHTIRPVERL